MLLFEVSKAFPREESYSLTAQLRRASRSVSANLVEAWRRRRYEGAFVAKLCDVEAEAAETQVWIEYAVRCGYLGRAEAVPLYREYDKLMATVVGMIRHADTWTIGRAAAPKRA